MVNALVWIVAGILLYTVLALALQARGLLPPSVKVTGPITTIHTRRGKAFLDWLATPRRFWRAWGNFGVGIALVVMVGSFLGVLFSAYSVLTQPQRTASPVSEPQNVLVIPGVNEFLPLSAAPEILFGLLLGLVVHEGGHGLLCRVGDIDIESMGVALFALLPVGAFVEPDEESRERADRGAQTRMFAAGVTNNFAVTLVAFALLFGPIVGSLAVAPGVPVGASPPGSAADAAGIGEGDRITAVGGTPVESKADLDAALANASGTVEVTLDGERTVTVERSLVVTRVTGHAIPTDVAGKRVTAVNGTPVHTEREFYAALENRSVAQFSFADGADGGDQPTTVTAPAGVYVSQVTSDGPLASAGAPTDAESFVVTSIGGQRTVNYADMGRALDGTSAGETVAVVAYVDGTRQEYNVTLGENPDADRGLLGVVAPPDAVSGMRVDDFGVVPYPAEQFLSILGGGEGGAGGLGVAGFFQRLVAVLFLPFLSVISPGIPFNFAGFVGPVTNYYQVTGPLAALGGWTFTLANVAFWTGWVNINLGLFNCVPTYPLDGGHILRTSTEAVISRLPFGQRRNLIDAVTTAVSLTMLTGLVLMVFGPQLLGG